MCLVLKHRKGCKKVTEKLFYEDSHMITFSAVVKACEKVGDYYEAVLDRTAFFPEGGGQYADMGYIDDVKVLDAHERDGVIYHKVEKELPVGKQVEGRIDWEERFSKMQHHSGEHIVSGLVNSIYGYDNVGFHMGKDAVTMDFNGALSKEQLKEIEKKANEAVVKNLDIQVLYPSKEELSEINYRSKIEIEGQVRIVIVPGYDTCACCAPHVKKTGEIGLIKLIGVQNYKGGVRVSMLCGFRAIDDYEAKSESVKRISVLLSAKEAEVADEVARLKEELASHKGRVAEMEQKLLQYKVNELPENEALVVLFESDLSGDAPRELANLLLGRGTEVGAVFAETGTNQYRYVIGSKSVDVRSFAKMLNEKFAGRGGGKPEMVQGSVSGAAEVIKEAVEACRKEMC
jgi:alanyl-tRNA synthetase